MNMIHRLGVITGRELNSYFETPLAYLFITVFMVLSNFFTFEVGQFFEREQADLLAFFSFHPWLYLVLVPPLAMRLWAEERQTGSIELLMTLPVTTVDAVLGKYLAAWLVCGLALLLTFPLWLTVNYLGDVDNGVVVAAYVGSWLMSGAFLALGSVLSALTRNQIVAFVLTFVFGLLLLLLGFAPVTQLLQQVLPATVAEVVVSMSFLSHFQSISRGVLDFVDVGFFLIFIGCGLLGSVAVVNWKKAG